MLNVAIVGAGLSGRWHSHHARRLGARVVGVVDPDPGAARRLASRFRGAASETSLGALLARAPVDVGHVCSPASTHAPIAEELVAAGAHALVEKPLAQSAAETREVAQKAKLAGVYVCPVHQYPHQRGYRAALARLAGLGPIRRIDFSICSHGGAGLPVDALDQLVADIMPHPLSLLQHALPGTRLPELEWTILHRAAGEVFASSAADDTLITMWISLGARPPEFVTRIHCTSGTLHIDGFHGYHLLLRGAATRTAKMLRPFAEASRHWATASANLGARLVRAEFAYPGLSEVISRFYQAVRQADERLLPSSAAQAIEVAVARDTLIAGMAAAR